MAEQQLEIDILEARRRRDQGMHDVLAQANQAWRDELDLLVGG
jgi:hypothetical protein